jgi:hypothetical protein
MDSIRSAIEKASSYLPEHPEAAAASDSAATAVREDGLCFRIKGRRGRAAPTPGWLLRAALAACDATGLAPGPWPKSGLRYSSRLARRSARRASSTSQSGSSRVEGQ